MRITSRPIIVSVALALTTGASAPGCAAPSAEPETPALVTTTCLGCHPGPQLSAVVQRKLQRDPTASLGDFLATHHAPDAGQRDAVVDYLERIASEPAETAAP